MAIAKTTSIIGLLLIALLNDVSQLVYANTNNANHVTFMQMAPNGILQKNGTGYQLTMIAADPWLIYFDDCTHSLPQLQSTHFLAEKQFYHSIQLAFKAHKNQPFVAEIIGIKPDNSIAQYNANINSISIDAKNKRITYQIDLPQNNNDKTNFTPKTLLKHIVILIDGDGVCINCGGPW